MMPLHAYFRRTKVICRYFGNALLLALLYINHTGQCLRRIAGGNVGLPLDTT